MPPPTSEDQPVVLVTGSEGLLGRAVSRRLAAAYHVIGTDRDPPYTGEAEGFVMMDVTSELSIRQGLDGVRQRCGGSNRIASVVHLAAYYDFSGKDSPLYEEVTVEGTRRLLRALQAFEVEQFLFTSTMLVHRPGRPGERITEDTPLEGTWAYPKSKIATEQVIHEERGDISAVIFRIAGVYTDWGQQPTLVQQIRRIYERDLESHLFPGDLRAGQSLVHLGDVVDAVARAVERRSELSGEVAILIGEPDPPGYGELQDHIGEALWGHDWRTIRVPEKVAKAGAWALDKLPGEAFIKPFMIARADDHYALDISRARALLGWMPRHRLLEALPAMLDRLKADPRAWYEENDLDPPTERPTFPEKA